LKRLVGSSLYIARCASVLMTLFSLSMPQVGAATPRERKSLSVASTATGDGSFDASEKKRDQSTGSWSADDLIEPADLARLLSSDQKPVVLQIGVVHLYKLAHIPGSKFVGMASEAEGIAFLKKEVEGLSRSKEIVCYCGCCPWDQCPNIRPAYKALREMGFTKIKMLHLPNTFTQDWAMKNFPVEKGA
jgi:thiosulfate/3-mercaptopyruvate sulfurtransferase